MFIAYILFISRNSMVLYGKNELIAPSAPWLKFFAEKSWIEFISAFDTDNEDILIIPKNSINNTFL